MQASDIYDLAVKCYHGDDSAREEWIQIMAPIARSAGRKYGVRPGIVIARAILESGWGSDQYEVALEKRFVGAVFARKAQKHNNLYGMVAYGGNDEYMPGIPVPAWALYGETFVDYGPHGDSGSYHITTERWKEYASVEDAAEDFCAVIRSQAWRRGEMWHDDVKSQLISMGRGYTPEGDASSEGMEYAWQDQTLELYDRYQLWRHDVEDNMAKIKMTTANLDKYIKAAYEYAHAHCIYAPSDRHYPAMEDGNGDCVGLVLNALAKMGYVTEAMNINDTPRACELAGMVKITDISTAKTMHGVVLMQDKYLAGTANVSHVFYWLGGGKKYDLGSDIRIRQNQPYTEVEFDEWPNKDFLCMYACADEPERKDAVPDYSDKSLTGGTIKKTVGIYTGPSTEYKRILRAKAGTPVIYGPPVSNGRGRYWRYCRVGSAWGWVYYSAVTPCPGMPDPYKAKIIKLGDGYAAVRAGAGTGCPEVGRISSGTIIRVTGLAYDAEGVKWLHVRRGDIRGYVVADLIKKI